MSFEIKELADLGALAGITNQAVTRMNARFHGASLAPDFLALFAPAY